MVSEQSLYLHFGQGEEPLKTMSTFKVEKNLFCILRWPKDRGTEAWKIIDYKQSVECQVDKGQTCVVHYCLPDIIYDYLDIKPLDTFMRELLKYVN